MERKINWVKMSTNIYSSKYQGIARIHKSSVESTFATLPCGKSFKAVAAKHGMAMEPHAKSVVTDVLKKTQKK